MPAANTTSTSWHAWTHIAWNVSNESFGWRLSPGVDQLSTESSTMSQFQRGYLCDQISINLGRWAPRPPCAPSPAAAAAATSAAAAPAPPTSQGSNHPSGKLNVASPHNDAGFSKAKLRQGVSNYVFPHGWVEESCLVSKWVLSCKFRFPTDPNSAWILKWQTPAGGCLHFGFQPESGFRLDGRLRLQSAQKGY